MKRLTRTAAAWAGVELAVLAAVAWLAFIFVPVVAWGGVMVLGGLAIAGGWLYLILGAPAFLWDRFLRSWWNGGGYRTLLVPLVIGTLVLLGLWVTALAVSFGVPWVEANFDKALGR